jgi:hypothetical protein
LKGAWFLLIACSDSSSSLQIEAILSFETSANIRQTTSASNTRRWYLKIFSVFNKKFNLYRILVGKPEVKRPLGRPRRKWVDNIKIDLGEIGWDGMDWIDLA